MKRCHPINFRHHYIIQRPVFNLSACIPFLSHSLFPNWFTIQTIWWKRQIVTLTAKFGPMCSVFFQIPFKMTGIIRAPKQLSHRSGPYHVKCCRHKKQNYVILHPQSFSWHRIKIMLLTKKREKRSSNWQFFHEDKRCEFLLSFVIIKTLYNPWELVLTLLCALIFLWGAEGAGRGKQNGKKDW